jgi:DNA-binding CsgD family transcriptional regulator
MIGATDAIVESIYDAALDDAKWLDCLTGFGDLTGSPASTAIWIENAGDVLLEITTTDDEIMRPYEEYYATTIPERFWSDRLRIGDIERLENFWDAGDYEKSEYHNDYALPYDMPVSVTTVVDRARYGTLRLCQCRTGGEGEFPDATRRLVPRFLPHFRRAFAIRDRLTDLRQNASAKAEALDRLPIGVLFLDHAGRVREMNRAARAMASAGDGFSIGRGGRLKGATPAISRRLEAVLAQTCTGRGDMLDTGGTVELPRPSGLRPYNGLVCPLRRLGFDIGLANWRAVLFLRDPDAEPEAPLDLIQRLHGLSRREAEAVWALSLGKSHHEIADDLSISIDTLRTYLRRAADKTGADRQADLVRLIIGNPFLAGDD